MLNLLSSDHHQALCRDALNETLHNDIEMDNDGIRLGHFGQVGGNYLLGGWLHEFGSKRRQDTHRQASQWHHFRKIEPRECLAVGTTVGLRGHEKTHVQQAISKAPNQGTNKPPMPQCLETYEYFYYAFNSHFPLLIL